MLRVAPRQIARTRRNAHAAAAVSLPVPLSSTVVEPTSPTAGLAPIVMLHGVLGSSGTYGSILRRKNFAPGRVKIGLDLRNHGHSPHATGMSYAAQAEDVAAALDALDVERAVIIGHSMGGKVAMQLALTAPHTVAALVVVDIAPVRYAPSSNPADARTAMIAMRAVHLDGCARREEVDAELQRNGLGSRTVRQFAMTNLVQDAQGKFRWRLNIDGIVEGLPEILGFPDHSGRVYQGRTCVVRGGKSQYVPFSAMKGYTALFPRMKLVTLADAGHWLQAERPDAYCESVNTFLAEEG